jgi:hypothetical protein
MQRRDQPDRKTRGRRIAEQFPSVPNLLKSLAAGMPTGIGTLPAFSL